MQTAYPQSAGTNRRDFLQLGAAAALGLTLPLQSQARSAPNRNNIQGIMIVLLGGPSPLDTWDPKPNAPSEIRGPFRPITTRIPGMQLSELFPLMAQQADKFTLIRSLHSDLPAVHEAGLQQIQTGRSYSASASPPHLGNWIASQKDGPTSRERHVILGNRLGWNGSSMPHGQEESLILSNSDDDLSSESERIRERYGRNPFGNNCLRARRLIEAGTRFVTLNMFESVYDAKTWDIHGTRPFTTFREMARYVAPMFDLAYSALLSDLAERGLLQSTLVSALGEFGRSPKINPFGGRDHHGGVWTMLMAGGGIPGGGIIGASDEIGYSPKETPVTPSDLFATQCKAFGVPTPAWLESSVLEGLL